MSIKKIAFLILFTFIFSCSKKEDFKPTVKLDSILKNEKLKKDYAEFRFDNIYLFSGIEKKESFMKFSREASIDDLVLMTECEKPIVRCFAFKILVEKDYPKIRELLFRHKNDNEYLDVLHPPCVRMNEMVKVYMLQQLDPFSNSKRKFNRADYDKVVADFFR
ncbi:hypothetical protein [Flavobacterium sp. LHD-85]|uniref:hypothetical protein n=1 Tax=Flavobacterium sp. LHD-85 TaxID=3071410 RepID=UPI0027E0AB2F|nr:hypothetical protein [Flavobacterium sp. LHD-85]MDQ6530757.1 hypothetical protein [Flavobacterium sp. LHD-85]